MTGTLRAGLIGLGIMGRNHARVLQSLPDVELVAAVDLHGQPRDASSRIDVLCSVRELINRGIDFCIVATPTKTHQVIGLELAEAGVPTLIEKPLAHDSKAAQTIVEAFARNGVLGGVGHIERFNPVLQNLRRRLACGELGVLRQVATRRQQPFPIRIADTGVTFDLATHDIDLTAWVTNSTYRFVSARVTHRSGSVHEDLVSAVAQLSSGVVVTHLANWLSPVKERITTITGELGYFVADTLTADLTFYPNDSPPSRYAILKSEPLMTELSNFAAAVRGESAELVTLREGLAAVCVAEALLESAATGETVEIARFIPQSPTLRGCGDGRRRGRGAE
jgi:UDP-N-acetylglucosamine 3-dehydrogenase